MTIDYMIGVLNAHGVPCIVEDGRLYADSMIGNTKLFEEVVDVTDFTKDELYKWLGY